ncbi:MAG: type II toxin-antitoxin system RelE/ParE family toxin [Xanthobacteraceae bacterium]
MKVFITKGFLRFARRQRISDNHLREAVGRAERGLVDANLGGGVIKQRIARPGQGRSGGFRVLVAYRPDRRAVFLYGFAKNERDNVDDDELETAQDVAKAWLGASANQIAQAITDGLIQEVEYDDDQ